MRDNKQHNESENTMSESTIPTRDLDRARERMSDETRGRAIREIEKKAKSFGHKLGRFSIVGGTPFSDEANFLGAKCEKCGHVAELHLYDATGRTASGFALFTHCPK